jgi:hypothetical protein
MTAHPVTTTGAVRTQGAANFEMFQRFPNNTYCGCAAVAVSRQAPWTRWFDLGCPRN